MNSHITDLENLIAAEHANITGLVVLKEGERVYESYFNGYSPGDTVNIMSVTKSITSALIGIAVDNGFIKGLDQKVLEFFPDYTVKRGEKTIQHVTVRHLLTMTAPYKYRSEPYSKVYSSDDWTKAALDLLGGRAGITGDFKYSTVGTQILSGIIESSTGRSVSDFAREYLFDPLGIKTPRSRILNSREDHFAFLKDKQVSGWVVDPKGVNTAGWGLCLTPRDMAGFGQLYLNGGVWNGRRILSKEWIDESTIEHSRWGDLPYGYLWWIVDCHGSPCCAAIGDGGNVIFMNPSRQMVVAVAARFTPRPKILTELIIDRIIPLFLFEKGDSKIGRFPGMDWIGGIQKAIDYIEAHITEELDFSMISEQSNSSSFHFQRVFSILCGFTLGDYIRMRRLSLAGRDLAATHVRVLDIAVKYCYSTQESFSRAFTRYHGVSPTQARSGANLKSFSSLAVKLSLDGGNIIDYRIETREAFKIVCKKIGISGSGELTNAEISGFWMQCGTDGTIPALINYVTEGNIFGPCIVGASFGRDASDKNYPYAIGAHYNGGPVTEEGFTLEEIPAHTYAVFKCVGAMPEAFTSLYHRIYSEFFPSSEYQPCGGTDFEAYPSAEVNDPCYTCEIWVAVEKK